MLDLMVAYDHGLDQCNDFKGRCRWRETCQDKALDAIARHRAAHDAALRAEIERLRQLVEDAHLEGWDDYENIIINERSKTPKNRDNSESKKALEPTP